MVRQRVLSEWITGRASVNSGCGGSHANGYGLRVMARPDPEPYFTQIRLEVVSYRHAHISSARAFTGWTPLGEISWSGGVTMNSCYGTVGDPPGLVGLEGSFEVYILP